MRIKQNDKVRNRGLRDMYVKKVQFSRLYY